MAKIHNVQFLILSDTHNFEFGDTNIVFQHPVPLVDVIIHCGDLTQFGDPRYYKQALKMLGSLHVELKLVIAGNHDLDLDGKYWKRYCKGGLEDDNDDPAQHEQVVNIVKGPLAKEAGVTYLEKGTSTFTLQNGATFTLYTSPYTREFHDMAFSYPRNEDRFNTAQQIDENEIISIAKNPIPTGVDIIMTHGTPKGILDDSPHGSLGCENLLRAVQRARPLMHCFGHFHTGYGAELVNWDRDNTLSSRGLRIPVSYSVAIECAPERGVETVMVNATIRDDAGRPINAPWLIYLPIRGAN